MSIQLQFKRCSKSVWEELNPVLADGEPALELYTFNIKIGDGVTRWNNLPYVIYTGFDDSPLKILTDFIPDATYNNSFSFQFIASGAALPVWSCVRFNGIVEPEDTINDSPIAFTSDVLSLTSDFRNIHIPVALPEGISFDSSTGVLSGTPKERGSFELKISASDGENYVYRNFIFRVL